MDQGWICRNCGEANSEGFTVCTRCGEVPDLPEGGMPGGKLLTKSRALDTTLAAFGTLFLCAIPLVGGALLTDSGRGWTIAAGFVASLAIGLAAIFLLRKNHRALMIGAIIGLCVAILNPLSLCLGILGFAGLAGN